MESFTVNEIGKIVFQEPLVGIDSFRKRMSCVQLLEGKQMEIEAVVVWCIINGRIKEAWDIPVTPTASVMKPYV